MTTPQPPVSPAEFIERTRALAEEGNTIAIAAQHRIDRAADPEAEAAAIAAQMQVALTRLTEAFRQIGRVVNAFFTGPAFRHVVNAIAAATDEAGNPDDCWRCDSVPAENKLGLCAECHDDLTRNN